MNLIERDRKVIWHPYTQQKMMKDPIPVVKGEGVYLIDESGKKYIDAISSWWVTIHGHAHPYIAKKIYEQAKKLEQVIFAGFTHQPAVELAERLLKLLPGDFARIFYSDNGSTAVEVAIKMALQFWWNKKDDTNTPHPRNKILALNNSYHGDTFGAMSISDRGVFTLAFQDKLFEVVFIDAPSNDSTLPEIEWKDIACFIYEPLIQGAGGMKVYSPDGLNSLLAQCKSNNIICIADEVMTGFGRTGNLFASEQCAVKPDIICLSKGLTGGTMALGVTACSNNIYEAFLSDDKMKTFFHGHSFTANPLACSAAIASLDLIEKDDCFQRRKMIASNHMDFIARVAQEFPALVKNARSLGTIATFEVESGKDGYLNNISSVVSEMSIANGVFLRSLGNTIYIMPPYCITEGELQKVYEVVNGILRRIRD